ncbi:hypothetical protein LguiA_021315 [Lonicera macranthoides]
MQIVIGALSVSLHDEHCNLSVSAQTLKDTMSTHSLKNSMKQNSKKHANQNEKVVFSHIN